MVQLKMPTGISNFPELIENGNYFADKSQFIAEIAANSAKVILLPRPRRFGKTLNMSMLQTWFERLPQGGTLSHLLDGFKASQLPGEHQAVRGKIPVIFLTFKELKESTWPEMLVKMSSLVAKEIERLSPWWQNKTLAQTTADALRELQNKKADKVLLGETLEYLAKALFQASGERPLLLVDEYDAPIQAGLLHGFFKEVVEFMRDFLSAGLKDRPEIWKGVLTGILRVSKENMFSGLNNLKVYPLTHREFDTCFGLLVPEVEALLSAANIADKMPEVQRWYNGYRFGASTVFNPWSVINFVSEPNEGCQPHWVNSGDTTLLKNAIADGDGILLREMEDLLAGIPVEKDIDDNVTYAPDGIRPTDVWSFMLYTGYLKVNGLIERRDLENRATLSIPNKEVEIAFARLVRDWTTAKLGRDADVTAMLQALVLGNESIFERHFAKCVLRTLSFYDVNEDHAEAFYHAFVTGLLVNLNSTHAVRSNRESGLGRYDVMLIPKDTKKYPGVVIEFKIMGKNQSPEAALDAAHGQIEEKKYAAELEGAGCTSVLKWAIAFRGKEVFLSLR